MKLGPFYATVREIPPCNKLRQCFPDYSTIHDTSKLVLESLVTYGAFCPPFLLLLDQRFDVARTLRTRRFKQNLVFDTQVAFCVVKVVRMICTAGRLAVPDALMTFCRFRLARCCRACACCQTGLVRLKDDIGEVGPSPMSTLENGSVLSPTPKSESCIDDRSSIQVETSSDALLGMALGQSLMAVGKIAFSRAVGRWFLQHRSTRGHHFAGSCCQDGSANISAYTCRKYVT
jgi:hypothetical protein